MQCTRVLTDFLVVLSAAAFVDFYTRFKNFRQQRSNNISVNWTSDHLPADKSDSEFEKQHAAKLIAAYDRVAPLLKFLNW